MRWQSIHGVQIQCEGVDYTSRTYDPFLDLSLEVVRASSVERALAAFTAPEVLDGANKYRCPKNNKLVRNGMHTWAARMKGSWAWRVCSSVTEMQTGGGTYLHLSGVSKWIRSQA